jgi:hypothetical protein
MSNTVGLALKLCLIDNYSPSFFLKNQFARLCQPFFTTSVNTLNLLSQIAKATRSLSADNRYSAEWDW